MKSSPFKKSKYTTSTTNFLEVVALISQGCDFARRQWPYEAITMTLLEVATTILKGKVRVTRLLSMGKMSEGRVGRRWGCLGFINFHLTIFFKSHLTLCG